MNAKNIAAVILYLLTCLIFTTSVLAGTLTGKIRVDDEFRLYLSSDDNLQGDLLLSGNSYNSVFAVNTPLTDGQTYYLHVYGKDRGGIAGLLAEFNLTGGYHAFNNNSSQVLSNTADWKVSNSGWENYVNASDSNGQNGTSSSDIAAEARWIWSSDPSNDKEVYFSLKITGQTTPIAGELTGKVRVDDKFSVYLSQSDDQQGELLVSGASWNSTYSLVAQLTDGENYYLHIYGEDTGGVAAFLGEFNLTGSDHVFSNEQSHILTNGTDWQVSTTGWADYVNATEVDGPDDNNPLISNEAKWLWTANPNDNQAYFSVAIISLSNTTTLTGALSIDNEFELYLSLDDYSQGTLIATGNEWQTTDKFSVDLVGQDDYYLHIRARDIGGVAAFLGEFSLSGGERVFANNKTNIVTNTSRWRVSTTGWGDYNNVTGYGNNGVQPWGTRPDITANATWIWSADANYDNDVYFSLRIFRYPQVSVDGTLSANVSVDNEFIAYLSTDDNVQGTSIASGNNWPTTYSFDVNLSEGQDYYLHIFAKDVGGLGGFLGEFNVSGNLHVFSNNQTSILTSPSNWNVSTSGWADYVPATSVNGNNGVEPWGTRPDISADATWIWTADPQNDNEVYFSVRLRPANSIDHFRIEHDTQGLTCDAESVVVKACADANCTSLYTQPTSITLAPGNWSGGNTFTFIGSMAKTVSITTAGNYSFSKIASSENADLRCFSATTESCDIDFVDAGFEFIGATVNDKTLLDQVAETNFSNVNLRAVQNTNGVCQSALTGTKSVTFSYDCISPDSCLTPLAGIPISHSAGENSGILDLTFDSNGIASLANLNFADAGRLNLTAQASISNAQIIKGSALLDVFPSYLQVNVAPVSLISTGASDTAKATAGEAFELQFGAYGAEGHLLKNYQPENFKLSVWRSLPSNSGTSDGQFKYSDSGYMNSSKFGYEYISVANLAFNNGLYSYPGAYYTEAGTISLDVQDASYLGNKICTVADPTCDLNDIRYLVLDSFIPAYYLVEKVEPVPVLENVQASFTYVGQSMQFAVDPSFKVTAKNALEQTTYNFDSTDWIYRPTLADVNATSPAKLSYLDKSDYAGNATVTKGTAPIIIGADNYDGSVIISLPGATIKYNKVDTDYTMFTPVDPFAAKIEVVLQAAFLTDARGICFRYDYSDPSAACEAFSFTDIGGADLRFGRFALKSTYGPENEVLRPEFAVEYFDNDQWLINILDNETTINFSQAANQLLLSKKGVGNDLTGSFDPVTSDGKLLLGVPDGSNDFEFSAPDPALPGEVYLRLNPTADPGGWPQYLNYDWSGDGKICNQVGLCVNGNGLDYPQAVLSFGLFRGNDRVIQWREVFN